MCAEQVIDPLYACADLVTFQLNGATANSQMPKPADAANTKATAGQHAKPVPKPTSKPQTAPSSMQLVDKTELPPPLPVLVVVLGQSVN